MAASHVSTSFTAFPSLSWRRVCPFKLPWRNPQLMSTLYSPIIAIPPATRKVSSTRLYTGPKALNPSYLLNRWNTGGLRINPVSQCTIGNLLSRAPHSFLSSLALHSQTNCKFLRGHTIVWPEASSAQREHDAPAAVSDRHRERRRILSVVLPFSRTLDQVDSLVPGFLDACGHTKSLATARNGGDAAGAASFDSLLPRVPQCCCVGVIVTHPLSHRASLSSSLKYHPGWSILQAETPQARRLTTSYTEDTECDPAMHSFISWEHLSMVWRREPLGARQSPCEYKMELRLTTAGFSHHSKA